MGVCVPRSKELSSVAAVVSFLLLASHGAWAADSADSSKSDSDHGLEEIVVTAQKRLERLQDVPISITAVSGEALDRASFSGTTEVLNTIPGVMVTQGVQGGGSNIRIRGVTAD